MSHKHDFQANRDSSVRALPARIPLTTTGRLVTDLSQLTVSHVMLGSIYALNRSTILCPVDKFSTFGNLKWTNDSSWYISSSLQSSTLNKVFVMPPAVRSGALSDRPTSLCSYRVRGVDGSCAEHLTVESYTAIYAANSHTYYYY